MAHFAVRLATAVQRCQNPVLVGLDPRADQLPAGLLAETDRDNPAAAADAYRVFCQGIIDVVAPRYSYNIKLIDVVAPRY